MASFLRAAWKPSTCCQYSPAWKQVASFLRVAWKPSTRRQYSSAWRQWCVWCCREGVDSATPSLNNLLSYLWYLYSVGKLNWHLIGVQHSAIAAILQPLAERTIERAVSLFMRASFLSRPPPRELKPIRDVGWVLRLLEGLGDTPDLSRPQLTHRMIMILVLASTLVFESFLKEDASSALAVSANREQQDALMSALRQRGSNFSRRQQEDRPRARRERTRSRSPRRDTDRPQHA